MQASCWRLATIFRSKDEHVDGNFLLVLMIGSAKNSLKCPSHFDMPACSIRINDRIDTNLCHCRSYMYIAYYLPSYIKIRIVLSHVMYE